MKFKFSFRKMSRGVNPNDPGQPLIRVSDKVNHPNFLNVDCPANQGKPSQDMPEMDYYLQVIPIPEEAWEHTTTRYLFLCFKSKL